VKKCELKVYNVLEINLLEQYLNGLEEFEPELGCGANIAK